MKKTFRLIIALMLMAMPLASIFMSCGKGNAYGDERSEEQKAILAAIDDSMEINSPNALSMIDKGLIGAKDSLEYYDYYLRLMRHKVYYNASDTVRIDWDKVYSYLNSLKPTPRVNGMIGFMRNTNALYEYRITHDIDKIINHYTIAYDKIKDSDMKESLPDICANLGDAYVNKNDMPVGAMWYRRALFLVDSLNLSDKHNVSLYLGLGRIYFSLGDFESALDCYNMTDRNIELLPKNMQIYFLNNFGNYYYYAENYPAALKQFLRLKKLLEDINMTGTYDMYICKVNLADVYLNLNRTEEATKYLDEASAFFNKVKFETGIYYSNTIRIGLELKRGNVAEVRRIIENENIKSVMDFNLVNIRHKYLRDYYVRSGNYKKAYYNLVENNLHNDSMEHNRTHMRTAEIMMRYAQDTLSLHHHIEMQKKDADIQRTEWGLYGIALLMVILVLLFLYYLTWSRKRRLLTHMQLMRIKLNSARSRISPHFIFNVLNNHITHTDQKAAEELMGLSKLIRANLNMSGKSYVSLKEELDFVNYYISVERRNIGDDFHFSVNAPSEDIQRQIFLPSMFIQILVENSIKHALKGKEGTKTLSIDVAQDGDYWIVNVTDNGPGFDIRRTNPNSTKTGLNVIRSSINIINSSKKRKIRLDIRNMKDNGGQITGCKVSIHIPPGLKPLEETD